MSRRNRIPVPSALLCGAFIFVGAGAWVGCEAPVQQGAAPPANASAGTGRGRTGASAAATPATGTTPAATPNAARNTAQAATADADGGVSAPPPLTLNDSDFTESDRARDPFRSFAREFIPQGPQVQVVENEIRLREYGLDELHLVAVVIGTDNPYAMVVDPTGRGTIIRRGDYVGRPETISSGGEGSVPHQVPWRVARIVGSRVRRGADNNLAEVPGEVVFEREDRLNPLAGRAERSMPLGTIEGTPGAAAAAQNSGFAPSTPGLPAIPGLGPGGSPFLPSLSPVNSPTAPGGSTRGGATTTVGPPVAGPGGSTVQSFTTVIPPQQPAQPPPTTVVIRTDPQGQTTVSGGGAQPAQVQTRPPDPYGPPPGGNSGPPPVRVTDGPTGGSNSLPRAGLGN